jgi:hypothetical protein
MSKVRRIRLVLAVHCLVMSLSPLLWAQLYTGTVTGAVTDASGAIVSGVNL